MEEGGEVLKVLRGMGLAFTQSGKGVYRLNTPHGAVMYYATRSRWQHRGRTATGTPEEMRQWLRQRGVA